jgi:hypothetical protein
LEEQKKQKSKNAKNVVKTRQGMNKAESAANLIDDEDDYGFENVRQYQARDYAQ